MLDVLTAAQSQAGPANNKVGNRSSKVSSFKTIFVFIVDRNKHYFMTIFRSLIFKRTYIQGNKKILTNPLNTRVFIKAYLYKRRFKN